MNQYAKFAAALLAAAGVVVSSGLLHGTAELILNTAIAAVGAALVYLVPNATAEPDDS
jgi:Na+-transporting NADH:ubiquinone oxidoreductase subunit NqrB